ncbi:MAG: DNA polymerase IV [Bacillota bacterium]|jgi:DNA polymerase-4
MDRVILHSDMNSFYASVECVERPELKKVPMAVGGSPESRHGIILAKNQAAKKFGIKTGEPLWQAFLKCRDLVVVPPNFPKYQKFSQMAREIYLQYTDRFEPYGIDEGWLDVTGSLGIFGSGEQIAYDLNRRIKKELGVTVSVGVSWNKIFAKLGSDYKKPDAVTVFDRENYQRLVYPLPVGELLYVGRATEQKLKIYGIRTIGDLAAAEAENLEKLLGKWGYVLHDFALGNDRSEVKIFSEEKLIKSVGNSTTTPRDLVSEEDVKIIFTVLAESVAMRLREHGMYGQTVRIQIRDKEFYDFSRQCKLDNPTCLASEIVKTAMYLFKKNYKWSRPVRLLGIAVADLMPYDEVFTQCDIFVSEREREKKEHLAAAVDSIRKKYGSLAIRPGCLLSDKDLSEFDPRAEHIVNPKPYKL